MDAMKKITVNLPSDQVSFLQEVAKKENVSVVDVLRRAINAEKFFVESENSNKKVLVEEKGRIREIIRR